MLTSGLVLGGVYAMVAVGFALPFGTNHLLHVAHGGVMAAGVYTFYVSAALAGIHPVPAILLSIIVSGFLALAIYEFFYKRLRRRNASRMILFLVSLGILLFMENVILLIFGANAVFLSYGAELGYVTFLGQNTPLIDLIAVVSSLVVLTGVIVFTSATDLGRAMRALASNRELSGLLGINLGKIDAYIFFISGVIAVPGALIFALRSSVYPTLGFDLVLIAAIASIVGGIGSLTGAMVGGLLLGLLQACSVWLLSSAWEQPISLGLLTLVLLMRPSGLFGRTNTRRA